MTTKLSIRWVSRAAALCAAAVTLAVVALQGPASATYYANIWACGDPCGYAKSDTPNEDMLYACDTYSPNDSTFHYVYGDFRFQGGEPYALRDRDPGSGCGVADWRSTPYWTVQLRAVQVNPAASSGWVYTDGLGGN